MSNLKNMEEINPLNELKKLNVKIENIYNEHMNKISMIKDEIKIILEDLENNENSKQILEKYNLTKSKDVCKYLDLHRQSLSRYISEGIFIIDIHFKIINNKRVYIPEGIMKFKKNYEKYSKKAKINNRIEKGTKRKINNINHLNNLFGRVA